MDDIELRSERIEREALKSLHAHCPDATRAALGLSLDEAGGALVASVTVDPSILINRALGLGVEAPASIDDVQAVIEAYARLSRNAQVVEGTGDADANASLGRAPCPCGKCMDRSYDKAR